MTLLQNIFNLTQNLTELKQTKTLILNIENQTEKLTFMSSEKEIY